MWASASAVPKEANIASCSRSIDGSKRPQLLEALADSTHREHEEFSEWVGCFDLRRTDDAVGFAAGR
jgi:hypothetical protein